MNVLVTGAHGFIGSHLCDALLKTGHRVKGLVSPWGKLDNLSLSLSASRFELIRADISLADSLEGCCEGVDAVIHAAARVADWGPWQAFYKTNVLGTQNMLKEAETRGVKRFVHISSIAVHPYSGFRCADTRKLIYDPEPLPYARSKIAAEKLVLASERITPVIIRPGLWPFGARDKTFERLVQSLEQGLLPYIGSGDSVLNTAYVGNLVQGILLALEKPQAAQQIYLIADAGMPSWREVFTYLAKQLGVMPPRLHLAPALLKPLSYGVDALWRYALPRKEPPLTPYRVSLMIKDVHFSLEHARRELGYAPTLSWQAGLNQSLQTLV